MTATKISELTEGDTVTGPNYKSGDVIMTGVIIDVLSTMFFVEFDDGTEDFIFKSEAVL